MGAVDIPSRAQSYFMANPSLSGRGSAVAGSPRQIHLGVCAAEPCGYLWWQGIGEDCGTRRGVNGNDVSTVRSGADVAAATGSSGVGAGGSFGAACE